jgi:hypothetical protein
MMNWVSIGIIAEVVAALAVIISVIYLATQIRQQTRSSQAEALRGNVEGDAALLAIAQDAELAKIFVSGLRSFSSLDSVESIRFSFVFGSMIGSAARHFRNVEFGLCSEAEFKAHNVGHLALLETPGGSAFWHANKHAWYDDFREFVTREFNIRPASDATVTQRLPN